MGKPLDSLLKDLEAPVKAFNWHSSRYVNQTVGITLLLDDRRTDNEKFNKKIASPTIYIDWEKPMKTDAIIELWRRNQGQWTDEVKEYFRGQTIGFLRVKEQKDFK